MDKNQTLSKNRCCLSDAQDRRMIGFNKKHNCAVCRVRTKDDEILDPATVYIYFGVTDHFESEETIAIERVDRFVRKYHELDRRNLRLIDEYAERLKGSVFIPEKKLDWFNRIILKILGLI